MRKPLFTFFAITFLFVFSIACSKEEHSNKPLRNDAIVKKQIIKPPPEKLESVSGLSVEKTDPQNTASQLQTSLEKRELGATRAEPERKQVKLDVDESLKADAGQSRSRGIPRAPSGLSVVAPGPEESKVASAPEQSNGVYLVDKGDTLAGVSGRREVFGDRLKWPILYRLNAEPLEPLPAADNLPDLPLPDGMKLRTVTSEEKTTNLEKRSGSIWVVNVLSAKTNAEAIPAVISLIRNGYPVYLVNAKVNDKDWIRVRVGFFKTKEEAEAQGKKIREILNFQDSWVTKPAMTEFMEFAGF